MKNNNTNVTELWNKISESKRPCCLIGTRFDLDAAGSGYALKSVLKRLYGINLTVFYFNRAPDSKMEKFLNLNELTVTSNTKDYPLDVYDLIITVDTQNESLLAKDNNFYLPEEIPVVNIDHHESNTMYGDMNYVLKGTGSNCRVLYEILTENKVKINKNEAYFLMLGVLTDTGILQYSEVDAGDFKMVSELMDLGVKPYEIIKKLRYENSYENFLAMKLIFNETRLDFNDKVGYLLLTKNTLDKYNISQDQMGLNPSDIIRMYEGIDLAVVVFEDTRESGAYNISLRSRYEYMDVSKIAEQFGGGGHKMAAACRLTEMPTEYEAYKTVLEFIKKSRGN